MKKFIFVFVVAMFASGGLMAQEIEEVKIDKFTQEKLAHTSREVLARNNSMKAPNVITYIVGGKKDNAGSIDYSIVVFASAVRIFSINKDQKVMFLLKDGTIITGSAPSYQIADRSNSRSFTEGTNNYTSCVEYEFKNFEWVSAENPITTVRVETDKTNIEADVKPANHTKFINCFELVKDAIQ